MAAKHMFSDVAEHGSVRCVELIDHIGVALIDLIGSSFGGNTIAICVRVGCGRSRHGFWWIDV